jgi:hypothetical protein
VRAHGRVQPDALDLNRALSCKLKRHVARLLYRHFGGRWEIIFRLCLQ